MRFFTIFTIIALCLFTIGCEGNDEGTKIDYDNPNLTGGLYFTPDKLIFSDNATQSFLFTYNNELMLLSGIDTSLVESVYAVSFKMDSCLASVAFGGLCTLDVKFKDPAYVCTDTVDKFIVLKFRYLYDFGAGYVKDHYFRVQCKSI